MEIGVFGSPGGGLFGAAIVLGFVGLICLALAVIVACSRGKVETHDNSKDRLRGVGVSGIVAFCLLIASMMLLPIGNGRQRMGDCFDRLPAATFAVDSAFTIDNEALYIVVRGKNKAGRVVRECAILPMSTVKDYPDDPVTPGKYWVVVKDHESSVVENHKSSGVKWTTNTFVPVQSGYVPVESK